MPVKLTEFGCCMWLQTAWGMYKKQKRKDSEKMK